MIAGVAGLCLFLFGWLTWWHHAPPVIAYDFHYQVTAPSALQSTQIFSGVHHTYVVVPPGNTLMHAVFLRHGHKHPVTPRRDGPYWRLRTVSREWRLTTTGGVVTATAIGSQAVKAMASRLHPAASAVVRPRRVLPQAPALLVDPKSESVTRPHERIVGLPFTGTRLSFTGQARLIALRPALTHAIRADIVAFSGSRSPQSHHVATRRAVMVAATLLRWGYPARHLHIRILAGPSAALKVVLFSAHTKDMTP